MLLCIVVDVKFLPPEFPRNDFNYLKKCTTKKLVHNDQKINMLCLFIVLVIEIESCSTIRYNLITPDINFKKISPANNLKNYISATRSRLPFVKR